MDTNYWIVAVLFAAAAVLSVFGLLGKRRHEAGREAVSVQIGRPAGAAVAGYPFDG